MRTKVTFLAGFATGYVLGSRAGRARYEQIRNGEANCDRQQHQRGVDDQRVVEGEVKHWELPSE